MSRHTEGPWKVFYAGEAGFRYTTIYGPDENPDHDSDTGEYRECIAEIVSNDHNARLIAAAPAMYEALQRVRGTAQAILDGDDLSGMSDCDLFGAILRVVEEALPLEGEEEA